MGDAFFKAFHAVCVCTLCACSVYAAQESDVSANSSADTGGAPSIQVPLERLQVDDPLDQPRVKNPAAAAGFSALIPGAGQLYTRSYVRGGLFLSAEIIAGLAAADRYQNYQFDKKMHNEWLDSVSLYQNQLENADSAQMAGARSAYYRSVLERDIDKYELRQNKYAWYSALGWTVGIYAWNIMDAAARSNWFHDDQPRNASVAGWLSAIPGLGLGQLYNGSLSKAGLIWMTQTMLGYLAYSNQQLMDFAAERRKPFLEQSDWRAEYAETGLREWDGKYRDAFSRRNMYLWYSVFFYFYGVFDAIVDAHLHDYRMRIRFDPDRAGGHAMRAEINGEF